MAEQIPQQLQLALEQHKEARRIEGENASVDHVPLPLEPTGDSERSPHVDENGRAILGSRALRGALRAELPNDKPVHSTHETRTARERSFDGQAQVIARQELKRSINSRR